MKKDFKIDIDCAACALKAEDAVAKLSGVKSCSVNFIMGKMRVQLEDGIDVDEKVKEIEKACKKVDHHCQLTEI